jgi:hypothetical protein
MTGMRAASRLLAAGALGAVLGWGPQSTGAQTAGPATQHRPEAAPKKLQATPKPRPKAVPKRKPKPTAKPKPQSYGLRAAAKQLLTTFVGLASVDARDTRAAA